MRSIEMGMGTGIIGRRMRIEMGFMLMVEGMAKSIVRISIRMIAIVARVIVRIGVVMRISRPLGNQYSQRTAWIKECLMRSLLR